jgi:hypothetical protein
VADPPQQRVGPAHGSIRRTRRLAGAVIGAGSTRRHLLLTLASS